jgi:hypothetical protein
MEKCFNCGAAVRPGAKFCTSCGTRLVDNEASTSTTTTPETSSWSQDAPAEETRVATPAARADDTPDTPGETTSTGDQAADAPYATWRAASSGEDTAQDLEQPLSPADRFEAALDARDETGDSATRSDAFSGWGSPAPTSEDRFASWSAAYGTTGEPREVQEDAATGSAAGDSTDEREKDGEIVAVESATIASDEADATETDAAGFTEGGDQEVDYLSGDENIAAGGPDSGIAAGRPSDASDARQRATALVEELRELVWKIGEQEPSRAGDTTDIRNELSAARGQVADFSDFEGVIAAVRESPRDVDALRELGAQAGRIEDLLESHGRLTAALDDAIRKLQ